MSGLRTVAFGDLGSGTWGAALAAAAETLVIVADSPEVAREDAPAHAHTTARLDGSGPDEDWRITGEGLELSITAVGEPAHATGGEPERTGFDQLCRVSGRFETADGSAHAVASLGIRGAREGSLEARRFEALRSVAAWFEPSDGLALAAFRGAGAAGQDRDLISAAVLDTESSAPVEDPRLSTTYSAEGWATRAGLELWLDGDEDQQLMRRASGEAVGARGEAAAGTLELRAELFRWNSHGRDGAGVYLIASRR